MIELFVLGHLSGTTHQKLGVGLWFLSEGFTRNLYRMVNLYYIYIYMQREWDCNIPVVDMEHSSYIEHEIMHRK